MMPDGVTQALGVDRPHYLGPAIVATGGDCPARQADRYASSSITCFPPAPAATSSFPWIPPSWGQGMGPYRVTDYTQNRATVHLHGNNTVWISDGTPHQWITPANETTRLSEGRQRVACP